MMLHSSERDLLGKWILCEGVMLPDETSQRIDKLVSEYLEEIAVDATGWDTLYQDPHDKRFWELLYPESSTQGGGSPRLLNISSEYAKQKYKA